MVCVCKLWRPSVFLILFNGRDRWSFVYSANKWSFAAICRERIEAVGWVDGCSMLNQKRIIVRWPCSLEWKFRTARTGDFFVPMIMRWILLFKFGFINVWSFTISSMKGKLSPTADLSLAGWCRSSSNRDWNAFTTGVHAFLFFAASAFNHDETHFNFMQWPPSPLLYLLVESPPGPFILINEKVVLAVSCNPRPFFQISKTRESGVAGSETWLKHITSLTFQLPIPLSQNI